VETELTVAFREEVLSLVFGIFRDQPAPDFGAMCEVAKYFRWVQKMCEK
jgi:hypothetical protein